MASREAAFHAAAGEDKALLYGELLMLRIEFEEKSRLYMDIYTEPCTDRISDCGSNLRRNLGFRLPLLVPRAMWRGWSRSWAVRGRRGGS